MLCAGASVALEAGPWSPQLPATTGHTLHPPPPQPASQPGPQLLARQFVITEKAPTRAFSWWKAATTAFTFKTLLSHYAKRTPRDDRVRGVLQPRPGQHTSTPLAAEVTPSHNRQPAARLCHVSRVTRPCQYYHHNAQPQVMHLSRLHHRHQPSPAQLGGGSQLGQAANNNNHCWHCYTRCSAPRLYSMVYLLTWMQEEAVLDECFIISINCVCNCVSINILSYIH